MEKYASYSRMGCQKAKNDSSIESSIGRFMFESLWSKFKDSERISDKKLQIKGIDVRIGNMNIDEKCKYYDKRTESGFMTTLLQYPSFELSFVNQSGNVQTGWFLNSESLTTHYAFIQPFVKDGVTSSNFTIDGIDKMNVLVFEKRGLNGIKEEYDLLSDSINLRDVCLVGGNERKPYPRKPYYLKCSSKFQEKPVNLIIPRSYLRLLPNSLELEWTSDTRKWKKIE